MNFVGLSGLDDCWYKTVLVEFAVPGEFSLTSGGLCWNFAKFGVFVCFLLV